MLLVGDGLFTGSVAIFSWCRELSNAMPASYIELGQIERDSYPRILPYGCTGG
jgi:hypothetical protein